MHARAPASAGGICSPSRGRSASERRSGVGARAPQWDRSSTRASPFGPPCSSPGEAARAHAADPPTFPWTTTVLSRWHMPCSFNSSSRFAIMKLSVVQLDLGGRRVFLRADFNVPLAGDAITDDTRIRAVIPTLEHCLHSGAAVVLASHLGRPGGRRDPRYSMKPIVFRLEELLGRPVALAPDSVGPVSRAARQVARARALSPAREPPLPQGGGDERP